VDGRPRNEFALNEVNAFCSQQGKLLLPIEMKSTNQISDYSVTFRCLPPDHPDVARFHLEPAPNYIIEQRNR
jgi:hypothetical protein